MLLSTILATGLKILVTVAAGTAIVLGIRYIFKEDEEQQQSPDQEKTEEEEDPTIITDGWGNSYSLGEKKSSHKETKAQKVIQTLQMGRFVIDNVIQIGNGLATMFNSIDAIFGMGNGNGYANPYVPMCESWQGTQTKESGWFINNMGERIPLNKPIPTQCSDGRVRYMIYTAPNIMHFMNQ